ncbi:MAG: FAD-dependent oxidoreductase, partial [Acetobacteraceae bacterium]|nr:FAD-dependent oxidoreductase [Acetobacteraceae bacterium]
MDHGGPVRLRRALRRGAVQPLRASPRRRDAGAVPPLAGGAGALGLADLRPAPALAALGRRLGRGARAPDGPDGDPRQHRLHRPRLRPRRLGAAPRRRRGGGRDPLGLSLPLAGGRDPVTEVAVIGGGPGGCAAAIALARAGRRVTLFERDAEPRESVCGEFLGGDAAAALRTLSLDPAALGAVPLSSCRVAAGGFEAASPLPFAAFGLSRRVLDGGLREAARAAGVAVVAGVPV